MLANPMALKLDLASRGVRLDEAVRQRSELFHLPFGGDSIIRRIELVLPEDVWVSVPIEARLAETSPYVLRTEGEQFRLRRDEQETGVRIVPQPRFYAAATRAGLPMWRVGTTYAGYLAINPAAACRFTPPGMPCRFCSTTALASDRQDPLTVDDVIETVHAALTEGAAEFVYFHIGDMGGDDRGVQFIEPYVAAIKKHFDTLVALQLQPPTSDRWIDRAYAAGADALSYDVEIHDAEVLHRYRGECADPSRRDRVYDALAYAATIFPSGTVWSDLILGLEPPESTMAGIDRLVRTGVLPVLTVPPRAEDLRPDDRGWSTESVSQVFAHLFNAVRTAKINMNWIRDLSFAVTPLEARFFAGDEWRTVSSLTPFYRSRLGTMAARNLARMRRRLRVRKVSDSFDSSHL